MLHTTGIVLRTVKYGETSVISDILTADKGLCTFIGGSVRTARSRMPYSLFQPMTMVDLVSYWRDDPNALHRLKECRASAIWQTIPFDLKRGSIALFLAEVTRKCAMPGESNPDLYQLLSDTLHHLDQSTESVANVHLFYLTELSGLLGFQPAIEPDHLPTGCFFDLKEGEFTPEAPSSGSSMSPVMVAFFLALLQSDLSNCHTIVLSRNDRKTLLQKLLQFYQMQQPGFGVIHSPEVLELVF
jgi:DNA repair protein RecO (recombination protein O)